MQIGKFRLSSIETGTFALDGGAMFGVVPKPLWQRKIPSDDRNRIHLAARALLLEEIGGPRKILIDTGLGQKWNAKLADIYGVDNSTLKLETSLQDHGLSTEDITDVLFTHLHFDHAGGATKKIDSVVPTFANARYAVQKRHLEWARDPSEKDRASFMSQDFDALEREGVLDTIDGDGEWIPGIELILSHGHTPFMQLPHIFGVDAEGKDEHLLYCADLIPTAAHVPVPWIMAYDNHAVATLKEKKGLLPRAVAEDWILFYEHDPDGPASRVIDTAKGYAAGERIKL